MVEPIRNPDGWFRAHLLILDWATMIAMGAVYQLMDVVLQRKVYSVKLGYLHYIGFTLGTIILLTGFLLSLVPLLATGAVLTLLGIGLFVWNVGVTMIQARQWNAVTISTACALVYLVLTAAIGAVMGLNFAFPIWLEGHDRLLASHIWMGMVGWFGMLITGFSYKMLPMFYLAHGHSTRLQSYIIVLLNLGVITGAETFLLGGGGVLQAVSIGLIVLAFGLYCVFINGVRKHRYKRNPGAGIWWTVQITKAMLILGVIILFSWLAFPEAYVQHQTTLIIGTAYLSGWVSLTILGYLSKIVPFLWWTHKYGPRAGQPNVPVMSSLISESFINRGLCCIASGVLLSIAGLFLEVKWFIEVGGTIVSVCSLFYIGIIVRVFFK
ncbi:hypothetical protein FHS18_003228 [Paenibacillus phyllosphaerae]|uniref:Uncharacterized protein n=1 Tax=Paenibacillus phyllosphaerae TaxID=274593 RepID=A0A7W5FNC2_9BACL|nr:hypothetical protein [Paenibacillus phyllosphaerae]MBB3111160.1 hypothetical protein [Paenibacillus phyllosphaerae]